MPTTTKEMDLPGLERRLRDHTFTNADLDAVADLIHHRLNPNAHWEQSFELRSGKIEEERDRMYAWMDQHGKLQPHMETHLASGALRALYYLNRAHEHLQFNSSGEALLVEKARQELLKALPKNQALDVELKKPDWVPFEIGDRIVSTPGYGDPMLGFVTHYTERGFAWSLNENVPLGVRIGVQVGGEEWTPGRWELDTTASSRRLLRSENYLYVEGSPIHFRGLDYVVSAVGKKYIDIVRVIHD